MPRENSYNLLDEAWIPVVDLTGWQKKVGLLELFRQAERLADLAVGSPQRIALMRLLVCIAQAALNGPATHEDWTNCKEDIADSVENYLEKRRDKFFLFGEKPFLQVPAHELKATNNSKTDSLDFGLASGTNHTLFDQDSREKGREHGPDWVALQILMFQNFSPGGRIGTTLWNRKETLGKGSSTDSPSIEASMLHSILIGVNMLATIHWNMVPFSSWVEDGKHSRQIGCPIWDHFPADVSDQKAWENATTTLLGRLVPLSRCMLVADDLICLTLANACSYPKLPQYRDPAGSVVVINPETKNEEQKYIRADPSRHPWRSICGILAQTNKGLGSAYALNNLRNLKSADAKDFKYTLWVGGVLSDKAKILDSCEWLFSLSTCLFSENGITAYQNGLNIAQQAETQIVFAVREYCSRMKFDSKKVVPDKVAKAKNCFWAFLDQRHHELIEVASVAARSNEIPLQNIADDEQRAVNVEQEKSMRAWRDTIYKAKCGAYEVVCPHETPRQIQAYTAGKRPLFMNRKETEIS
ncbi:MAG: type I-E CRISPR-associated protein Cse1/CasA [Thermoguttaceae bacterium]